MPTVVSSWVQLGAFGQQRQPEVEDLHPAFGSHDQIARLDVAMHHSLGMSGGQAVGNLARKAESFLQRQETAFNLGVEALALDEFHDEEGLAALLADFMDGANVGMTEPGGGLCFSVETLAGLFVFEQMRRQELESNRAFKLGVLGLVDDTHAALADLGGDAVVGDRLADHAGPVRHEDCTAKADEPQPNRGVFSNSG